MIRSFIKRALRWGSISFVLSAVLNGYVIFAQRGAVSPWGSKDLLWLETLLTLPIIAGLLFTPATVLWWLMFGEGREDRESTFLLCVVTGMYFFAYGVCFRTAAQVRQDGFHKFIERSASLVAAIKDYEKKYGQPPPSLADLVPEFLPRIPKTGMDAYPEYQYGGLGGGRAPWSLSVSIPKGFLETDHLVYFPQQNYDEIYGHGRYIRYRDWAYVFYTD